MKSLRESLFDADLADKDYVIIEAWIKEYLSLYDEYTIDTKQKRILIKNYVPILQIKGISTPFKGFPKGYDILIEDKNSGNLKNIERIDFFNRVESFDNWPKTVEPHIVFGSVDNTPIEINPNAFKDLSRYNRKIKNISYCTTYGFSADFNGVDMSELTSNVQSINFNSTSRCAQNCKVIFNPNMKVEKLSLGDQYHVLGIQNLPIIKSRLSFWGGRMEKVETMIMQLKDVGKTNFNKIIISGSNLTTSEKEEIRKMLLQEQGS